MPVTFVCMFVAAMSISGVPPFNGFVSKWMIYQGTIEMGPNGVVFLAAAVFGSALTLASFVKILHAVFFGPKPDNMKEDAPGRAGRLALNAPMVVLAVLCVALGLFAPWALSVAVAPAMESLGVDLRTEDGLTLTSGSPSMDFMRGLWTPGAAMLLIVLGIAAGLVVFFIGRGRRTRVVEPYLAGEHYAGEKARYAGTSFYRTIEELPVIGTVYRDAEDGAYDLYYLGSRYGSTFVGLLQRLHSGILPVYVSWCIIGLTILVAYFVSRLGIS